MNVGFIGLGIMGTPMAANLVAAGHTLQVFDLKPVPASLSDKGVGSCGSGCEVAQRSDVIITMVPDTPHVAAALVRGRAGLDQFTDECARDPAVIAMRRKVEVVRDGAIPRACRVARPSST